MNGKSFFKSTSFKCLITLLCVLLVSGIFLTIMNSLLAVTDQERFDRAINKIYGRPVKTEAVAVANYNDNATIDEAYKIKDDGNYLIKSTGKGGYENGTVTCWIVVKINNGSIGGIEKVVIDSNKGQSYIDRVGAKALNQFSELYEKDIVYTPDIITGATVMSTKNAICNAVNGALDFVNVLCGNVTTEGEKLLKSIQTLYGEIEIQVYGAGDTLITAESETVTSFVPEPVKQGNATINSVYKVRFTEDEKEVLHYVVSSTGTGGFENGTVTMLTALTIEDGAIKSVYKVAITANKSQSYIGKINHLDKYAGAAYTEGLEFTNGNGFVSSGATFTSTAINNAINGGIRYVELNLDTLNTPAEGGEENE